MKALTHCINTVCVKCDKSPSYDSRARAHGRESHRIQTSHLSQTRIHANSRFFAYTPFRAGPSQGVRAAGDADRGLSLAEGFLK